MPSALASYTSSMPDDAARLDEGVAVPKQTAVRAARKKSAEPAICPTDDDAVVPKRKAKDKQSWDYIWRSGVAGGLAGCAVSIP